MLYYKSDDLEKQIRGPILSNFPTLVQPQCSLKVRELMFPYLKEDTVTVSPPQDAIACPIGMAAPALENWIGLGLRRI